MKATKLRRQGKKLEQVEFNLLICQLEHALNKAGFITEISQINSGSIKIGQHMRTFSIDVSKHGYNTQVNPYGQRRTNLPNWDQRVVFNNIVNRIFNKFKISANIKSGPYTLRDGMTSMDEYHWQDQKPIWVYENERKGWYLKAGDYKKGA